MLTRRDLIPLVLALLLLAAVGLMAFDVRRDRSDAPWRDPSYGGTELAGGEARGAPGEGRPGTVDPRDLGAVRLRDAALPAPTRDLAEIQRTLARRAPGTYIEHMLRRSPRLVRWPDRTVEALRVWVQPHADVPAWNDAFPQVARNAFSEWSAAGFPIRFLHVVDSAGADVHIEFIAAFPGRQLGVTRLLHDRNGWIVGATIAIATGDGEGGAFDPSLVAGIARHEVGHALGLGHADNVSAVMYPEAHTTTIGDADRATLHLLYTLPPGPVR